MPSDHRRLLYPEASASFQYRGCLAVRPILLWSRIAAKIAENFINNLNSNIKNKTFELSKMRNNYLKFFNKTFTSHVSKEL